VRTAVASASIATAVLAGVIFALSKSLRGIDATNQAALDAEDAASSGGFLAQPASAAR
jgi:hypothetical protein